MKKRVCLVLSTAVLGFLGATHPASAANLTWDPSHTGTASDGSGNWNTTDANWWNGSAAVAVTPIAQISGVASGATATGSPVISLLSTTGLTVGQYFGGTNIPIGSTIVSIDTVLNKVTISANATGNANNQLFQAADKFTIGAGTGAGGTITLTAPGGVNTLTFAANSGNYIISESGTAPLTLTAGPSSPANLTIGAGTNVTFNNEVSITNPNQPGTINVADGQTLTFAKAGNALSSILVGGANATVKVTGSTGAGNLGTVNIGSGAAETGGLQISGAATLGGGWQIGTLVGNAYALLSTGGTANINGTSQLSIGRNGVTNFGKLRVDGGTLNITSTATAPVFIGRSSGNGTLKVTAGTVNAVASTSQIQVASDTNSVGLLDISGGTVNALANFLPWGQ